eukprot:CAMPEP_0119536152 /NCGR_PEP_ID=MMETSP1344-20130328/49054_1 /TAXON_ID=236787 /ORGANISM="Florenciella parvula, Strain CCMP2471" /LENGTH=243 /DNA_ID=CAMNT_0007578075 /DNA_START=164 /DNA_END=892 /DNA_ORIENTATION=-
MAAGRAQILLIFTIGFSQWCNAASASAAGGLRSNGTPGTLIDHDAPSALGTGGPQPRSDKTPVDVDEDADEYDGTQRQLAGSCPANCFGTTCDDWENDGDDPYTCAESEADGCDCGGCACTGSSGSGGGGGACPTTCFGGSCDYWVAQDGDTCAALTDSYGCDCHGCTCPGEACAPTCYGQDCDYWETYNSEDTCANLESTYGCDCSGCACFSTATSAPTPANVTSSCYTLSMHDSVGDGWDG